MQDVCRKLEVYFCGYESTEEIEQHLLEKVCMDHVESMSEEELQKMMQELNIPTKNPRKYMIVAALQMTIRRGGGLFTRIVAYITRMVSRMLIGRGTLLIGSNVLSKTLGTLAGPLGWVITPDGLFTIYRHRLIGLLYRGLSKWHVCVCNKQIEWYKYGRRNNESN